VVDEKVWSHKLVREVFPHKYGSSLFCEDLLSYVLLC
jgi:hypothetical protein